MLWTRTRRRHASVRLLLLPGLFGHYYWRLVALAEGIEVILKDFWGPSPAIILNHRHWICGARSAALTLLLRTIVIVPLALFPYSSFLHPALF